MPIDPQDLPLILGSNGGEASPPDPQNLPLIFGLAPNFAEGFAVLAIAVSGAGAHGVVGNGAATLRFTASGVGEVVLDETEGDASARVAFAGAGTGAHGRLGNGVGAIHFGAGGVGQHAISGAGVGWLAFSATCTGYLSPAGYVEATLLHGVGEGQYLGLGFDPTKRMATGFKAPWLPAQDLQPEQRYPWGLAARGDDDTRVTWGTTTARDNERRIPWVRAKKTDRDLRAPWGGPMLQRQPERSYPWVRSKKTDRDLRAPWGGPMGVTQFERSFPWFLSAKNDRDLWVPWGGPMVDGDTETRVPWAEGKATHWEQYIPWTQYSRTLSPGWGVVTPNNPGASPGETITVPVQGVYIVQNTVTLVRVDTLDPIPAFAMTLNIDTASWTWGFSASVAPAALALLQPNVNDDPVELQAAINGTIFQVFVERISRERAFNQATLRISGRGRSAILDKPYAAIQTWANTQPRTAQQLINDALTINNVPIGWDVQWNITDWLVPTGAWNLRGSHMDAAVAIAKAGGAYIQPDPIDTILRVKPFYPIAPWDWPTATPDFILPAAVVTRESIEWVEKPGYNGVYVSGTGQGILAHVRRTGSAGDLLAEMVTDALITHTDAARQRGISVLGDTGRQARVVLKLPVLDETGVIEPGAFVQFEDGAVTRRGYVRGTQIEIGQPDAWQTIEVETHES